jgi:hypothetical protein
MTPILLALAVALPATPWGRVSGSEFSLTVEGAHAEVLPAGQPASTSAAAGSVTAALTLFPGGVRDDPTPIALQPFLQRASHLTVAATFGTLDAPPGGAGGDLAASRSETRASASAEVFVHPSVAITGATGFRLDDASPSARRFAVPLRIGLAARLGDLRIEVAWDGAWLRDDRPAAAQRFTSRLTTDLRAVLVNHIDLALGALAGEGRIEAWFQATYYPTRRLGLTAGGSGGGHGDLLVPSFASARDPSAAAPFELPGAAHFGCRIGFSYWPTPALGLVAHYGATWISGDTAGATDQRAVVTLLGRAP